MVAHNTDADIYWRFNKNYKHTSNNYSLAPTTFQVRPEKTRAQEKRGFTEEIQTL